MQSRRRSSTPMPAACEMESGPDADAPDGPGGSVEFTELAAALADEAELWPATAAAWAAAAALAADACCCIWR